MATVTIDPVFIERGDVCALSPHAFRLHFSAMFYLTRYPELEWFLPPHVVKYLRRVDQAKPRHIQELEMAGLWEPVTLATRTGVLYTGWRVSRVHEPTQSRRPYIPRATRAAVYDRDGWCCQICGTREQLTLDHIVPYSHGGPDTVDNLRTLCHPCNSRRGADRLTDEEVRDGR
jgi:hypothetical protein